MHTFPPMSPTTDRGTIVIADDDPDVLAIVSARFTDAGYCVRTASHGAEAIAVLQEVAAPTAIFVDLMMPGVLGHSVLEFIQSETRFATCRVAVVTGSPELAPAGVRVFTKPATFAALLDHVERPANPPIRTARALGLT